MMSDQEFDARWQHNQEQRAAEAKAVEGKWDQADALLLVESGWTQEKIAEKVGRTQKTVSQWLLFGRFVDYTLGYNHRSKAPVASIPLSLTRKAFQKAWSKTRKRSPDGKKHNEKDRFDQARQILEAKFQLDPLGIDVARQKIDVGKMLVKDYADGDWMTREQVLADLEIQGVDEERLRSAVALMRERNTHGCMVEEKRVKGQDLFRIRKLPNKPQIKSEKVVHFYEEAMPLLKEARGLTDRNVTTISAQAILHKIVLLERLVKGLYEELSNE